MLMVIVMCVSWEMAWRVYWMETLCLTVGSGVFTCVCIVFGVDMADSV